MGTHIQGVTILILVVATLWGVTRLVGPAISEALGADGAIIARSADESSLVEPVDTTQQTDDSPLTVDEISTLQWLLAVEGFLDPQTDVDGLLGPKTSGAITNAKATFGIPTANDRVLISLLEGRNAEQLDQPPQP